MTGPAEVVPDTMPAWVVERPGPITGGPLRRVDLPVPAPGPGEVLVEVTACAVCRTDLHLAEGDLAPRRPRTVPGHEVVGRVVAAAPGVTRWRAGDRVGIAWLRGTCGTCRWCRGGAENLCPGSSYTGWDADGGFAAYAVVAADFAYRLPDRYGDAEVAPLLCAGIIGWRALRRAGVGEGTRLGMYGFGASAHLAAQAALALGATVHVLTRSERARALALELGAASAGGAADRPPEPLDAAILFAPVGDLVPVALEALDRGGRLAIAGISLTDVPPLTYERHLFYEKELVSVTSNTRDDGASFLAAADRHGLRVVTTAYPFAAADRALRDLAGDRVDGAAVLLAP